jgi:subtilisin family serine protease
MDYWFFNDPNDRFSTGKTVIRSKIGQGTPLDYRSAPLRFVFCFRLIVFLLAFTQPIFAQQTVLHNGRPAVGEEILIRLRSNTPDTLDRVRRDASFATIKPLNAALGLHLVRARGNNLTALLQAFSNRPDVLYAEPNYIVQTVTTNPNDLAFPLLWGMMQIGAPNAWDITTGGTSAVLGVVDTGIDYTHPDLAGNVWSAPSAFTVSIQGDLVNCPAGSHGFNALTLSCDPLDDNNHGTHVSGTIGATGNNSVGVAGVNWRGQVMGLKFLNATGTGPISGAINAIEFAIQVKSAFAGTLTPVNVRVLSNSWSGAGFSQSLLDEIHRANANEMLFLAAAGNASANNDASAFYPANYSTLASNVITVAATDGGDGLAGFSNYGANTVQLGAPGVSIYSTIRGGGYALFDGTSMSTPHVAGAALLTLAACPSLTTAGLKNAILANVDPVPALSGKTTTGGRLNVNNTVRSCAVSSSSLNATYVGSTGEDYVNGPDWQPNGIPDWHIRLQGLRGIPTNVRITGADGGVWEAPFNGTNWIVATYFAGDGTGHLWFEPWSSPSSFHVKVWYADSTTDEADVAGAVATLSATYLGSTGEDYLNGIDWQPNGIPDWYIQLQGLRGTPTNVRITSADGGVWETPFNGTNWIVATYFAGDGTGHLWFEPWSSPSGLHVKVWYSDSTSQEADVF